MKKILRYILKVLAQAVLAKYKPEIVGITGSVGKTSAKEACFAVLSPKFRTRKNLKNYNNEIGLPLSILGFESAGKSIFGWAMIIIKTIKLILIRDEYYPEILILEMGVDRPGDMKYLLSIAKPKVGVITTVGESHLEFFGTVDKVKEEKGSLIKELPVSGWAILNNDDEGTISLANQTKAKIFSYGFEERAKIRAKNISSLGIINNEKGILFDLIYNDTPYPVSLPRTISRPAIYSALAATAVGLAFNIEIREIIVSLKKFIPPLGRMNLIPGLNDCYIIDDTYNSSPQSAVAALESINNVKLPEGAKKIAILGEMYELGNFSEDGHKKVGAKAAEIKIDKLITIGDMASLIDKGAIDANMDKSNIFHFANKEVATVFINASVNPGDLILVKGSQGMRMEKIVKEIMADPQKAGELLVRQGSEWTDK